MQKNQGQGSVFVLKIEGKQTDGRTRPIASPSVIGNKLMQTWLARDNREK